MNKALIVVIILVAFLLVVGGIQLVLRSTTDDNAPDNAPDQKGAGVVRVVSGRT